MTSESAGQDQLNGQRRRPPVDLIPIDKLNYVAGVEVREAARVPPMRGDTKMMGRVGK